MISVTLMLMVMSNPVKEPWNAELTAKIKEAWPIEWPDPAPKFYSLSRKYQNLYTMNNGTFKGRNIDPLHNETLQFSGGMDGLQQWGSGKGLMIPAGKKILVWEEDTNVRALALVPRHRWKFPVGRVAYDVLLGKAVIFEIRNQTRTEEGWETKILYKEPKFAPVGYKGAGQACANCHNQPSQIVERPGEIYLMVRWGDDGRFSWRPFDDAGKLDSRWPISTK